MPKLEVTTQRCFIPSGSRINNYCTVIIELHNGVTHYNNEDQSLHSVDYNRELQSKVAQAVASPIVVLSAPKINACHFVLVRSQQNSQRFSMAHINPADDRRSSYTDLLAPFERGETLDVVSYRDISIDLLTPLATGKGCNLSTIRAIPSVFDFEPFVFTGEPKSVFINFVPAEDRLIIFSDDFCETKNPAVHIAGEIFQDSSKPIIFNEIINIAHQPMNNWREFRAVIPLLTNRAMHDLPNSRLYRYQTVPPAIATDEVKKRLATIIKGFDFLSENVLPPLVPTTSLTLPIDAPDAKAGGVDEAAGRHIRDESLSTGHNPNSLFAQDIASEPQPTTTKSSADDADADEHTKSGENFKTR